MPADIVWKQGDTHIAATDTLAYSDGSPVNLTGATVKFMVRALSAASPLPLTGQVQITSPANGAVQFTPSLADTSTPGQYMANWVVTFADASVMAFPTVGYLSVSIEQNLATVGGAQIVSLPDVKDYLTMFGVGTDRTHDAKLLRFINAATPVIENVVGPVLVRTFDEWHAGGQYFVQLRRKPSFALGTDPVLTLMACEEYRGPTKYPLSIVTDPAAATTYSVMLDPRSATVYRRSTGGGLIPFAAGPWGGGLPDAVHVIYQAGQNTVPGNVAEAALETIRVNYQGTMATGAGSLAFADTEGQGGPPLGFFLPRKALELLSPMRRRPAIA